MSPLDTVRSRFAMVLAPVMLAVAFAPTPTHAESGVCMRLAPRTAASRPDVDGPGSFGPLQDTLTLGCLDYTGFAAVDGKPVAILVDENGVEYRVGLGHYVGENNGRVVAIDEHRIEIEQLLRDDQGDYFEVTTWLLRSHGE